MNFNDISLTYLLPIIVAFLTGVAGPVIVTFIKYVLGIRKIKELQRRKNDFNTTIHVQQKINDSINSFQTKYELDRVWIAQFHNGGNFYPGNKSMKKMSVTFESTKPGVAADIMKMQNLPVSFFSSILQELNTSQTLYIVDPSATEDHALSSFWRNRGIKKSYLFPVMCIEGGFIGIFGVDIVTARLEIELGVLKVLEDEAKTLSGYVAAVSIEKA